MSSPVPALYLSLPACPASSRLSRGEGASVRGTGSRSIPHRLNADERRVYESAKKKVCVARGTCCRLLLLIAPEMWHTHALTCHNVGI